MSASNLPFSRNYLLQIMFAVYLVFWIVTAISPTDRTQWLMENILPVGTVIVLVCTYRKFPFSNLSYLFIFILLIFHTYAAHYTYQHTPFDMWLKYSFHTQRSYFDRIVHLVFGLCFTYPVRELLTRVTAIRGFWSFALPVTVVFSLSAFFEIIEMLVAIAAGQIGANYMGLQGDIFDSQKDMGLGLVGAIFTMWVLSRNVEA